MKSQEIVEALRPVGQAAVVDQLIKTLRASHVPVDRAELEQLIRRLPARFPHLDHHVVDDWIWNTRRRFLAAVCEGEARMLDRVVTRDQPPHQLLVFMSTVLASQPLEAHRTLALQGIFQDTLKSYARTSFLNPGQLKRISQPLQTRLDGHLLPRLSEWFPDPRRRASLLERQVKLIGETTPNDYLHNDGPPADQLAAWRVETQREVTKALQGTSAALVFFYMLGLKGGPADD